MPVLTECVAHLVGLGHGLVHAVAVGLGIRHKLPEGLGIAHQGLLLSGHRDFNLRRKYVSAMTQMSELWCFLFWLYLVKALSRKKLVFH